MPATFRFLLTSAVCLMVAQAAPAQVAAAYALADHTTGFVLESYKGDAKRQIGSLTKIATVKVVLDWAAKTNTDLAQGVVVPPQALINAGGVNPMGLQQNDVISIGTWSTRPCFRRVIPRHRPRPFISAVIFAPMEGRS